MSREDNQKHLKPLHYKTTDRSSTYNKKWVTISNCHPPCLTNSKPIQDNSRQSEPILPLALSSIACQRPGQPIALPSKPKSSADYQRIRWYHTRRPPHTSREYPRARTQRAEAPKARQATANRLGARAISTPVYT
jgi:hypothetical protein